MPKTAYFSLYAPKSRLSYVSFKVVCPIWDDKLPGSLVEMEFLFVLNMLRMSTGRKVIPLSFQLENPVVSDEVIDFLAVKPLISNENIMTFQRSDVEIPFISRNDDLCNLLYYPIQNKMNEVASKGIYTNRVNSAIANLLVNGELAIETVANKIGVGPRTLQRKLKEEATTYNRELNNVRKELAIHYLVKPI